ncbi:MAG: tRNA (adenosine(37)-N6)-threonylcarbamoyltransferase complex transferase subunit TsaD [bacterium]
MKKDKFITLGIETSCDETSVALLAGRDELLCNLIASQVELHSRFGGVVPELAARQHEAKINPLLEVATSESGVGLDEIDLIGVTVGPGLAVSLSVGIACARTLCSLLDVDCVGVSHLLGHLMAGFMHGEKPVLPAVCLLASGGHTEIFRINSPLDIERMGGTIDDAAGEAFDKVARMLGLGYPGGPAIEKASAGVASTGIRFPRPMLDRENHDFSFSGLKTAVLNFVKKNPDAPAEKVAAAFQEAAVEVMVEKTVRAALESDAKQVMICGGVAANVLLRKRIAQRCGEEGIPSSVPPFELCTDNAGMIARTAYELNFAENNGHPLTPVPNLSI